jgi:hypothetical protein
VVVAFGIVAGLTLAADYGFWRPWLLATYALVVIVAVNGAVIEGGWARRRLGADQIGSIVAEPYCAIHASKNRASPRLIGIDRSRVEKLERLRDKRRRDRSHSIIVLD